MDSIEDVLAEVGLNSTESKVYRSALRLGPASLGVLCRAAGLHRPNAYDALARLSRRGLVSVGQAGKRKVYFAAPPTRLQGLLEEKSLRLERILPELIRSSASSTGPSVDVFSGSEGIKAILDDELSVGQTIHSIQSPDTVDSKAPVYLARSRKKRAAAGMALKIIYGTGELAAARFASGYPNTQVRLSSERFEVTVDVYGDRTVIVFGPDPTIVRIRDSSTAQRFLASFRQAWSASSLVRASNTKS